MYGRNRKAVRLGEKYPPFAIYPTKCDCTFEGVPILMGEEVEVQQKWDICK
jgi:hypothetical protein